MKLSGRFSGSFQVLVQLDIIKSDEVTRERFSGFAFGGGHIGAAKSCRGVE